MANYFYGYQFFLILPGRVTIEKACLLMVRWNHAAVMNENMLICIVK
jgi:hypothetical protein